MRIFHYVITTALFLSACGTQEEHEDRRTRPRTPSDTEERIAELEKKYLELLGTQSQLNDLVMSDFATCPNAGDTADPLVNKICKVAQAATVEAKVELKGQLGVLSDALAEQLTAVNNSINDVQNQITAEVASITTQISAINTTLTTITTSLAALTTRMDDAEAAIDALETLTASIAGTVAGTMESLDIGEENVAGGPFYESVLRRTDKAKIVAYVEAQGGSLTLGANPLAAVNNTPTITVTSTAHGLAVGDTVHLTNFTSGRGFTSGELTGDFTVATVPTANTFTITMPHNANATGTFGGTVGVAYKILGRGLGTIWKTIDGADAAVRTATGGTKNYNFIVQADGDICYSTVVPLADFATISAVGANIICK